ncbi:MAG: hypothetical protein ACYDEV_02350 [Acidiferrobacter sp.]
MSHTRLSRALFGLVFISGTAFAMPPMKPMAPGSERAPMMVSHHLMHSAVPMLLPIAEMRSNALHLSDEQVSTLAVWRNRHMRAAIPLLKRLRDDKSALSHSLLEGADKDVLDNMINRLDTDHARMLKLEVAQVRIVHKTLSQSQWHQLLIMYQRMQTMGLGMMHR